MKIIINERAENILLQNILKEEISGWSDKVDLVKKFLDDNFIKGNMVTQDREDGLPKNKGVVIMVDSFKQPQQYLSDVDLFYLLQDKFQNILPPDEEEDDEELAHDIEDKLDKALEDVQKKVKKVTHKTRDNFIKQVIKDWYYNKISPYGNLSIY